jgi:predicted  nucleic acid-binding Zn-ribbon protein
MTDKVYEINIEIRAVESRIEYLNSMISLCMSEANLLDLEIEELTLSGLKLKEKLRDLRAELKDTI